MLRYTIITILCLLMPWHGQAGINVSFSAANDSADVCLKRPDLKRFHFWSQYMLGVATDSTEVYLARSYYCNSLALSIGDTQPDSIEAMSMSVLRHFAGFTTPTALKAVGNAYISLGYCSLSRNDSEAAISHFSDARNSFELCNRSGRVFECMWQIVNIYVNCGKLAMAAEICGQLISRSKERGEDDNYHWAVYNMCRIFSRAQDYANMNNYGNIIWYDTTYLEKHPIFNIVCLTGRINKAMYTKRFDLVRKHSEEVVRISRARNVPQVSYTLFACLAAAVACAIDGELDKAQAYYDDAEAVGAFVDERNRNLFHLAHVSILIARNRPDEALRYADRHLDIHSVKANHAIVPVYFSLMQRIYTAKNDYKSAYRLMCVNDSYTDSVSHLCAVERGIHMETTFRKDATLMRQKEEMYGNQVEVDKRRMLLLILFAATVLILVLWLLYINIARRRYTKRKQAQLIEQKERLEVEVMSQTISLRKQYDEIKRKNTSIMESIVYAEHIQRSILPNPQDLNVEGVEGLFVIFRPKVVVSGDFYLFMCRGGKLMVACADCSGHGVSGALMSMVGATMLNDLCSNNINQSASQLLMRMDTRLKYIMTKHDKSHRLKDNINISVLVLDLETLKASMAAARQHIYVYGRRGFTDVAGVKRSIGANSHFDLGEYDFVGREVQLEKGDCVYMFTDGITDQFGGPERSKLLPKRLKEMLSSVTEMPVKAQQLELEKMFNEWRGDNDLIDDSLLVGLKI